MEKEMKIVQNRRGTGKFTEFTVKVVDPDEVCVFLGDEREERAIVIYVHGKVLEHIDTMSVQYLRNNRYGDIELGDELYDEVAEDYLYRAVLNPDEIEQILNFIEKLDEDN